jgi:hypothetical protein
MVYFPRKSLSKYLILDTIDFNKHVHDIDIFINDKWRKYVGGDIGRLFKITRRLDQREQYVIFNVLKEYCIPKEEEKVKSTFNDFFARIAL